MHVLCQSAVRLTVGRGTLPACSFAAFRCITFIVHTHMYVYIHMYIYIYIYIYILYVYNELAGASQSSTIQGHYLQARKALGLPLRHLVFSPNGYTPMPRRVPGFDVRGYTASAISACFTVIWFHWKKFRTSTPFGTEEQTHKSPLSHPSFPLPLARSPPFPFPGAEKTHREHFEQPELL